MVGEGEAEVTKLVDGEDIGMVDAVYASSSAHMC